MKMNIMPPDHVCVSTNPPLTHPMFSLDKTSRNQGIEPVNRTLANLVPLGGWCFIQRHPLGVVLVCKQGPLPHGAATVSGKGGHLFPSRAPLYPDSARRTASAQSEHLLSVLHEVLAGPAVTGCLGNKSQRMAEESQQTSLQHSRALSGVLLLKSDRGLDNAPPPQLRHCLEQRRPSAFMLRATWPSCPGLTAFLLL